METSLDISIAVAYFLTEVPPLLAIVAIYRRRRARSEWTPCAGMMR